MQALINNRHSYCVGGDLHVPVNNDIDSILLYGEYTIYDNNMLTP